MYRPIQVASPKRRANVIAKARYSLYKSELREDFLSKCGYCDTSDHYSGGKRGYHIDHFAPKSKFAHLKNDYGNLVYCCPICNIGKSNDWPGNDPLVSFVGDKGFVDPCHADYGTHLARSLVGEIVPLTGLGAYIHKKLRLNLKRRQICWLLDRMEEQLEQLRKMLENKKFEADKDEIKALCELQGEYFKYMGQLKRAE
jgi:5-methylcytosine-specific restriction endonuclease McrA